MHAFEILQMVDRSMRKVLIGVVVIATASLVAVYLLVPVLGPVLGLTPWPVPQATDVVAAPAGATPNMPGAAARPRIAPVNLTGTRANEGVEYFRVDLRKRARAAVFDAFSLPWSSFCAPEGRDRLKDALNYYFFHRLNQQRLYHVDGGDVSAEGEAKWATLADLRVEQLTLEAFRRGNFKLTDLEQIAARGVAMVVRHERPGERDCSDRSDPELPAGETASAPEDEPLMNGEADRRRERNDIREAALRTAERALAAPCDHQRQASLVNALSHYFTLRTDEEVRIPGTWGEAGARYVAEAWSTKEDQRIVELARTAVAEARLAASELRPSARKAFAHAVKGVAAAAPACEG
jgi:hypothetical protein